MSLNEIAVIFWSFCLFFGAGAVAFSRRPSIQLAGFLFSGFSASSIFWILGAEHLSLVLLSFDFCILLVAIPGFLRGRLPGNSQKSDRVGVFIGGITFLLLLFGLFTSFSTQLPLVRSVFFQTESSDDIQALGRLFLVERPFMIYILGFFGFVSIVGAAVVQRRPNETP